MIIQAPIIINTAAPAQNFVFLPFIFGLLFFILIVWVALIIIRIKFRRDPRLKIFLLTVPKYESINQVGRGRRWNMQLRKAPPAVHSRLQTNIQICSL
jgi:hypothetical protein